jgi:hypothetical protein
VRLRAHLFVRSNQKAIPQHVAGGLSAYDEARS